jgi:acyl carrier protein
MNKMQDYETILKRVCELLVPFVEKGTTLREDSDFVADLNFDSLKVMKLVEQVEDEYDISIPLNILPDVQTVKDFVEQLQKLVVS